MAAPPSGIVGTPVISATGISNDFTYNITAAGDTGELQLHHRPF